MRGVGSAVVVFMTVLGACADPLRVGIPGVGGDAPEVQLDVSFVDAGDSIPPWFNGITGRTVPAAIAPAGGVALIRGSFWPGRTGGKLRPVTERDLVFAGTRISGTRANTGVIWYATQLPLPVPTADHTLALPTSTGVATPTARRLPRLAAAGPPVVEAVAIRVPVEPVDTTRLYSTPSRSWRGVVTQGDRMMEVFEGGWMRPTVALPRHQGLTGPITVRLEQRTFATNAMEASSDSVYRVMINTTASLRWSGLDVPSPPRVVP